MAKRKETKERIIRAGEKVFFENGYEGTSVRMILEEADVTAGSFYHFFSSKEELFEAVTERFLQRYTENVCRHFSNGSLSFAEQIRAFLSELYSAFGTYYAVLQADRLHWTVQKSLHEKTVEAMIDPLAQLIERMIREGKIRSRLKEDPMTLAALLIRGTEAILHTVPSDPQAVRSSAKEKRIRDYICLILETVNPE